MPRVAAGTTPARGDKGEHHLVALPVAGHAFPDLDDGPGTLVAENFRQGMHDGAVEKREIAVADAAGGDFDHHLIFSGRVHLDLLDDDRLFHFIGDGGFCLHGRSPRAAGIET